MTELTLQLSDKTLKKLRALAMLSGTTVPELEKEFANYFDEMLSQNITAHLSQLDGKDYSVSQPTFSVSEHPHEAEKSHEAEEEDPNSHDLSSDDLPEEVKSVAEEVEEIVLPMLNAPDAGENAEAFLDAAMASDRKNKSQEPKIVSIGGVTGHLQQARKGFDPRRLGARVDEYTGDN